VSLGGIFGVYAHMNKIKIKKKTPLVFGPNNACKYESMN
jgi:hypothetical protein